MNVSINGVQLVIKLADDDVKRIKGLMNTPHLEHNTGMLFRWPSPEQRSFWMKDTSIPLDIAYISAAGKITNIEKMEPYSLKSVMSSEPVVCALEVNAGWFEENGVSPGDTVHGVFNDMPKITEPLIAESSKFRLSEKDFYYQDVVDPVVNDIMTLLPDVAPLEEIEYLNDYAWGYPVDIDAWATNWGDEIPFFEVILIITPEEFAIDHPGWNIHGSAGEGSSAPGSLEVNIQVHPGTRFTPELIMALEAELSNVVAHELHHLTQSGAPFERPNCPDAPRRKGDSYHEYFTSACEVPAFLIGFRAASSKLGFEVGDLIAEYLDNQVSAGLVSPTEAEDIAARWTGHDLWSTN